MKEGKEYRLSFDPHHTMNQATNKLFECDEKEEFEEEIRVRQPGEAPDGGWGWFVVLGALICCAFIDGLIFSFDAMETEIMEYYNLTEEQPVLLIGMVFGSFSLIGGPLTALLVSKFGCRKVAMAGSVVTCAALLISTQMPSVFLLTLSYGVMGGLGMGMVHISAIIIVSQWFEHKRAFATGLALMGSGIGVLVFPPMYTKLIKHNDWKNATVIIGALFLNCAVGGALFRPLSSAKQKRMKRGVIQRGAIMKALIAEKERQRTISNGSLDNCIITKDNRLIKIDKIDISNKSTSYINRLKETFGFSSRSLNRSKNSLIINKKKVSDPIVINPKLASPKPSVHNRTVKPADMPSPSMTRDSGCGNSLESPELKAKNYDATQGDPWEQETLVVKLPARSHENQSEAAKAAVSERNLNSIDSPNRYIEKLAPLSCGASPIGSRVNIVNRQRHASTSYSMRSGAAAYPLMSTPSVMTVPSVHSVEMSTIYEDEELGGCKLGRKICEKFDLMLLKSPTFLLLLLTSFLTMFCFIIPYVHLPQKAKLIGVAVPKAKFLITILWVASMIGRPFLGWICDRPWASSVMMNNVLLLCAGTLSLFSHFFVTYDWLAFYAAFFGLFTAAFLTLRSIMLIELFGKERLTSSFGLLTCFQGIALLAGYQLAGNCGPVTGLYIVGIVLILAGISGCPLNRVKRWEQERIHSLQIVGIEEIGGEQEVTKVELCESSI